MKKLITLFLLLSISITISAQLYKYEEMLGEWKCHKIVKKDWKTDEILATKIVNQHYIFYCGGFFIDKENPHNPANGELLTGPFSKDGKMGNIDLVDRLTIQVIRLYFDGATREEKLKGTFKIIFISHNEMILKGCEDGYTWNGTLYFHHFKKLDNVEEYDDGDSSVGY